MADEELYWVVEADTGARVISKPVPLVEAKQVQKDKLEEAKQGGSERKLVLKQYLKG